MGKPSRSAARDEEAADSGSDDSSDGGGPVWGSEAEDMAGDGDDDDAQQVVSPFGPEVFASAAECWAHAAEKHGFSLKQLRDQIGRGAWTDYHRIRLVNYLRSLGPESALVEASKLGPDSGIWEDDAWLRPVLDDDMLLFEDDPDDAFEEDAAGREVPPAAASEEEVVRLRAELAAMRRLLSSAESDEEDSLQALLAPERSHASGGRAAAAGGPQSDPSDDRFDLEQCRGLLSGPRLAEAFRRCALAQPARFEGKTMLNAGCGGGLLCCVGAQLGTRAVIGVDMSPGALAAARSLASANGFDSEVLLLRGRADEERDQAHGPGKGGGLACDVLTSERLLGDARYTAQLPAFLAARRRHLRPGGLVLPRRAALRVRAADFSAEADLREAWRRWEPLGGLDLSPLAPGVGLPCTAEHVAAVPTDRIASVEASELFMLDLGSAAPADALLDEVPFSLRLDPERCATALVLTLDLYLDGEEGVPGALEGAQGDRCPWQQPGQQSAPRHTLLHLPAPGPPPARPLKLPGAQFPTITGKISAASDGDGGRLEISVELVAQRGGTDFRTSATFSVP